MLNKSILVGRITKDLEVRYTQSGKAVGQTSIAVTRNFSSANGETESDFINIVIWGKSAETFATYTAKGNLVSVVGRIQTRSYENDEGKMIYITEVVSDSVQFLDTKKSQEKQSNNKRYTSDPSDPFANGDPIDIKDSDLPF